MKIDVIRVLKQIEPGSEAHKHAKKALDSRPDPEWTKVSAADQLRMKNVVMENSARERRDEFVKRWNAGEYDVPGERPNRKMGKEKPSYD